jgi:hypothetical protein
MTAIQREAFDRLVKTNQGLCSCGNLIGSSKCDRPHPSPCTGKATEPVINPGGLVTAVVCRACITGRISTPASPGRKAKEMNEMDADERAIYDRVGNAADWRCMCDNGTGRARCSKPHAAMPLGRTRCSHGAFVLVTEPDGSHAVICRDCAADRAALPTRTARKAKAERAKAWKSAQASIFDLIDEGADS